MEELNAGSVRQQRGKVTLNKLKIWWKNERQRERRKGGLHSGKARGQSEHVNPPPRRGRQQIFVQDDDEEEEDVFGAERDAGGRMKGPNDPLMGSAPSPHRSGLSSPSPHHLSMVSPTRSEPCSSPLRQPDLSGTYRADLALPGVSSPYRPELGGQAVTVPARTVPNSPGEFVHILHLQPPDYPLAPDRRTQQQ